MPLPCAKIHAIRAMSSFEPRVGGWSCCIPSRNSCRQITDAKQLLYWTGHCWATSSRLRPPEVSPQLPESLLGQLGGGGGGGGGEGFGLGLGLEPACPHVVQQRPRLCAVPQMPLLFTATQLWNLPPVSRLMKESDSSACPAHEDADGGGGLEHEQLLCFFSNSALKSLAVKLK